MVQPFYHLYLIILKSESENQSADISWKLGGEGNLSSLNIERASDGMSFEKIMQYNGDQINTSTSFEYMDQLNNPSGTYAYRLQMISSDGVISYSSVQTVSFDSENGFQVQAINTGNEFSKLSRERGEVGQLYFQFIQSERK